MHLVFFFCSPRGSLIGKAKGKGHITKCISFSISCSNPLSKLHSENQEKRNGMSWNGSPLVETLLQGRKSLTGLTYDIGMWRGCHPGPV